MTDANVALRWGQGERDRNWNGPGMRVLDGMAQRLQIGTLVIRAPDGTARRFGSGAQPKAELSVHNPRLAFRILRRGSLGFAEGFIAGDLDTPDLEAVLRLFLVNYERLRKQFEPSRLVRALSGIYHRLHRNTRRGSRRNIHAHYDLGNAFYGAWLDPSMTYSSAMFSDDGDLEVAQASKYRHLADLMGLHAGQHVLEVGCGWGGFAVYAAERGCEVTALTISEEQHAYTSARVAAAGLADRVNVRFQDYRDVRGTFDAIVSIEMFEAVGEAFWPVFFDRLRSLLRDDGRVGLQVITIADEYFDDYRCSVDFIQRYVFPGGMLPSPSRLRTEAERAGLSFERKATFGPDYAQTLRLWTERFAAAWPRIQCQSQRFDERFRRLWCYYLAYCEAGFRVGTTNVEQSVFRRA
ncbi:MAG: cyclopropane-fatty-acyl-phospholipid synthase family protein [Pseudomonadota bacterium]